MSGTVSSDEVAEYETYPDLPINNKSITPLTQTLIDHLSSVQLFSDSHDQGDAGRESNELWTWFELVILQDKDAEHPIKHGSVELAWRSHRNSPLSEDFSWNNGKLFNEDSDLRRCLNEGNAIGVRICACFEGWKLEARKALLIFDISKDIKKRGDPPQYDNLASRINLMKTAIEAVNDQHKAPFTPELARQVTSQAGALKSDKEEPLRVLSLDGGGVRGLSTLLILQAVLKQAKTGKQPFELFHLIGGTSTGGLIAIMLGRLRMSVDDCIACYKKFMGTAFDNKASLWSLTFLNRGTFYKKEQLEEAIKKVVTDQKQDPEVKLNDPTNPSACKVFVLAVRREGLNNRAPVFLRSYYNPGKTLELPNVKLWEAARATSAAPVFFPPIDVGGTMLVDGGLAANNPLGWLWTEVATVFTPGRATDCFLSIGTGIPPNSALPDISGSLLHLFDLAGRAFNFGTDLISAATNTESTNVLFSVLLNEFAPVVGGKKYFRLNYDDIVLTTDPKALENYVDLGAMDDASEKTVELMETKTNEWIKNHATLVGEAASALKRSVEAAAKAQQTASQPQ